MTACALPRFMFTWVPSGECQAYSKEYVAGIGSWGGLVCSHWQEQTAGIFGQGWHWVPNAIVLTVTKALLGFLYGQPVVFHPSLHSALSNITSF